jgi:hypothetical protein
VAFAARRICATLEAISPAINSAGSGSPTRASRERSGRQCAGDVAIDCGSEDMNISPEEARANIVAAYTKQHNEAVNGLKAAFERAHGDRYGKAKSADRNDEPGRWSQ